VAIGDTPYDATAAGKAGVATIGVLCGGFTETSLREAGCFEVFRGPAALFAYCHVESNIFGSPVSP
jgi:phosphoglycolate phosphatase-like HAD superfamily hydrolase